MEKPFSFGLQIQKSKLKEDWKISQRIELARSKGASAIFYYTKGLEESLEKYEHYFNKPKTKLADDIEAKAPVVQLTKEPSNAFLKSGKLSLGKLEKKGLKKFTNFTSSFQLNIDKPSEDLTGENVIAFIPGTELQNEVIVLTAHYDHIGKNDSLIFNGADDDGTGTVSLLEIAQAFSKAVKEGHRPQKKYFDHAGFRRRKRLIGLQVLHQPPNFSLGEYRRQFKY